MGCHTAGGACDVIHDGRHIGRYLGFYRKSGGQKTLIKGPLGRRSCPVCEGYK